MWIGGQVQFSESKQLTSIGDQELYESLSIGVRLRIGAVT